MWWTDRPRRALASAAALCAAGALGACASGPKASADSAMALTPTQQHSIQVQQVPDQLALNPHATGLSGNQRAAVAGFVGRWRDTERADISIHTPAMGDPTAVERTAADLRSLLVESGVPEQQVRIGPYDTASAPAAPILVSFQRFEAKGPDCSGLWGNLTSTGANQVTEHFGCAVTANLAAMIADPRDILAPAASQAPDPTRRATVLQNYRAGQNTSSARDDQATGTVSQAVQ